MYFVDGCVLIKWCLRCVLLLVIGCGFALIVVFEFGWFEVLSFVYFDFDVFIF